MKKQNTRLDYVKLLSAWLIYDLAKRFNFFYHECPIGTEENEALKKARLALASATGMVLKSGLEVLGIPVPKRM